jgi:hypothetical protein
MLGKVSLCVLDAGFVVAADAGSALTADSPLTASIAAEAAMTEIRRSM